jgi:anti-sigma factor RsiW
MAEHLTPDQVARYIQRRLSSAEFLAFDEHLATCEPCRQAVSDPKWLQAAYAFLRQDVKNEEKLGLTHLAYEQMAAYVDNEIGDADREIVDSHVEQCCICGDELRDLQAFRAAYYVTPTATEAPDSAKTNDREEPFWWKLTHFWSFPRYLAGATAAAVLIVLAAGLSRSNLLHRSAPTIVEQSPPSHSSSLPTLPSTEAPPVTASVHGGQSKGLAQKLDMPSDLATLIGQTGTLMGSASEKASFALLSPVGTFVQTVRPTFRWQRLTGATEYKVRVFDTSLNELVVSPPSTTTVWKSKLPLQRGKVYLWQVTAVKDSEQIVSPTPPAPQAKFKVIDQTRANELDNLKRTQPDAHFSLGKAYASTGVLEEAEQEFRLVPVSDSNYALAQKFLSELQALRLPKR